MKKQKYIQMLFIGLLVLTSVLQTSILMAQEDLNIPPAAQKGNPKIQSAISELIDVFKVEGQVASQQFALQRHIFLFDEDKIRVIILLNALSARQKISAVPGVVIEGRYENLLQMVAPLASLEQIANIPEVRYIRLPLQPQKNVTSQGVTVTDADVLHDAGIKGAGVKVAVLDVGFTGYEPLLGGELPASVIAKSFYDSPSGNGDIGGEGEVHGTANAEIIYDMAPEASLYLVNFNSEVELAYAVDWLISEDVDIISHSLAWFPEPNDGTGQIAEQANKARDAGILWVNSAGNYAKQHYEGTFVSTDDDPVHDFSTFPLDEVNTFVDDLGSPLYIYQGDTIWVFLTWDEWPATGQDYDLGLVRLSDMAIVVWSENVQDGDAPPTEYISYVVPQSGYYGVAILKYDATRNVYLELFTSHDLEHREPAHSVTSPAIADGALAVGAAYWDTYDTCQIEPFSSRGPRMDGLPKPDLVAPDGVTTATYDPFYGTSPSAPYVAGGAALIKSANPSLSLDQLRNELITNNVLDCAPPGWDATFGYGLLKLTPCTIPPITIASYDGNEGENNWYISDVIVKLDATDNCGSGIKATYYQIDGGGWQEYSGPFTITKEGSNIEIEYYSVDNAGNNEDPPNSDEVKIDKTKPDTPFVTDDGSYTDSTTELHATWTSFDATSGIVEYWYAIGTTPGGNDVVDWTSVGLDTEVTHTGLSLTYGEIYYFAVECKDNAGLMSDVGNSDGIMSVLVDVSVSAPSEVSINESFTADVSVTEVFSNLDTAYFLLSFDPAVLKATDVRAGDLTASATPTFDIDNTNGTVTVMVNMPGLTGVSGVGTIAQIDFAVIGCDPEFSDLTLSDVLLGDIDAQEIPSVVDEPTVQVNVTLCEPDVCVFAPSEVAVGTSFTADVCVTEISNLDTAYFSLSFDPTVLEATDVRAGDLTASATPTFNIDNTNGKVAVMVNMPGLTGVSGVGIIAKVEFNVISCGGGSDLSLSNVLLGDINAREIESTIGDSVHVSIISLFAGDVSGDCNVTAYDASLILQHVVGLKELSSIEQEKADVTGDDTVSALDAALILQFSVGLIASFPVDSAPIAPALNPKTENKLLTEAIEQLETISLTKEQKQVLEQLKNLVFSQLIPKHAALLQNFPNPFNPDTWLPYKLASASPVTISIYNTKGQLIHTIALGNKNAGVYTSKNKAAYWDGRDSLGEKVASGVYFYQLKTGDFSATRKLLLLK